MTHSDKRRKQCTRGCGFSHMNLKLTRRIENLEIIQGPRPEDLLATLTAMAMRRLTPSDRALCEQADRLPERKLTDNHKRSRIRYKDITDLLVKELPDAHLEAIAELDPGCSAL